MEVQKDLNGNLLEDFEAASAEKTPTVVQEEISSAEKTNQEVTLDDLDSTPENEKFRIITSEDKIPEKLTISDIKLGKAFDKDKEGNFIEPSTNNKGGKYYKAKLIVEIEELIGGDKIRTFIPSIFYSVNDDETIAKIPTIPKACDDDKLGDHFTSELSQLRNKFCKFKNINPKDLSSSQFLKGLKGQSFKPEVLKGEYKKTNWVKLGIKDFI